MSGRRTSPRARPRPGSVRLTGSGGVTATADRSHRQDRDAPQGAVREPVRTCVGCRERAGRSVLLRVVVSGAGGTPSVVPDPGHRAPGRGASLHPDPSCLAAAERRRAFPRALRRQGVLDLTAVRSYVAAVAGDRSEDPVAGRDVPTTPSQSEAGLKLMSTQ